MGRLPVNETLSRTAGLLNSLGFRRYGQLLGEADCADAQHAARLVRGSMRRSITADLGLAEDRPVPRLTFLRDADPGDEAA